LALLLEPNDGVNMIRHNHVAATPRFERLELFHEYRNGFVSQAVMVQQTPMVIATERDELRVSFSIVNAPSAHVAGRQR
jgi:hypothetical protein